MDKYRKKIDYNLITLINNIQNPIVLEMGVKTGISTKKIFGICKNNDRHLYSIDINDCKNVFSSKKLTFVQSSDAEFKYIKSKIPKKLNLGKIP